MAQGGRARVESVLQVLGVRFDPKPVLGWLWGQCPYHADTTPSWRIRLTHERYGQHHCFSCKAGGTLAELVAHIRKIDLESSIEWLDQFADKTPVIEVDLADAISVEIVQPPKSFFVPSDVIFHQLADWVTPAREYMQARGVSPAQVARYRIGYAVQGRLGGRIVIPTYTAGFRMGAYQARDFTGHRKAKRYLYPSSEDKPNLDVMFGEHTWPSAQDRRTETIVVTEGAFNALAVDRASARVYVTALGGSDMREAHVAKLATFGRVLVFTDSDVAGDRIAGLLSAALWRHTKVERVRIPTDPADRSGKNARDANDLSVQELRSVLSDQRV